MNAHTKAFSELLSGLAETPLERRARLKIERTASAKAMVAEMIADHPEWKDPAWLEREAVREFERRQRGADHQDEINPADPYNLFGPHHSSRTGE